MNEHYKSPVPDLIYSDYRQRRIEKLLEHFTTKKHELPDCWNRITLFTTFRCNLDCVYCKTIRTDQDKPYPAKNKEVDLAQFEKMLNTLLVRPVKHIHFTGGEATLVPDLPAMVAMAAKHNILTSTTTNGAADFSVYEKLVEAGISEIRISLDSHDPQKFDKIVRQKGAYQRITGNIKNLVKLRNKKNHHPFIIINMCIGYHNRQLLAEYLKTSLELDTDDVKLLAMVQTRANLRDFRTHNQVLQNINSYLTGYSPDEYPLLRYKLNTIFTENGLGLKDITSRQIMRNCFVPLTERTMDTTYYYPCSVYLREDGKPLGRLDEDDLQEQQVKILDFVSQTSCRDDTICKEYCINCCKKFNLKANITLNRTVTGMDGSEKAIDVELFTDREIPLSEIQDTLRKIRSIKNSILAGLHDNPYLIIKPEGLKHQAWIEKFLSEKGLKITERKHIADWNQTAMLIYNNDPTEAKILRGLVLKNALPKHTGNASALLLVFENEITTANLIKIKMDIREHLKPYYCLIHHQDEMFVTEMNYVHVPDSKK